MSICIKCRDRYTSRQNSICSVCRMASVDKAWEKIIAKSSVVKSCKKA